MVSKLKKVAVSICILLAVLCCSCQSNKVPKDALQLSAESLSQRQMQTRRFESTSEADLLSASAELLQDLGFQIDEAETKLGLVVASKDRDAKDIKQALGAILVSMLTYSEVSIEVKQKIRASLVVRPASFDEISNNYYVRVTFQRIVWDQREQISKIESLNEPPAYQAFFDMLSKSVFLQTHRI